MKNKRVLIAFFDHLEALKLESIVKILTQCDVNITNSYEDSIASYNNKLHEFIILDHKTKDGNFFIEDILKIKAKQNIILISDTLKCPISCDDCVEGFKFLRLVKPIDYKVLIPFLNKETTFKCINQYKYSEVSTVNQLNDLLYVKDNLVYNQKKIDNDKLILSSKDGKYDSTFMLREYTLIEEIISNGFFKIELVLDNKIEIKKFRRRL